MYVWYWLPARECEETMLSGDFVPGYSTTGFQPERHRGQGYSTTGFQPEPVPCVLGCSSTGFQPELFLFSRGSDDGCYASMFKHGPDGFASFHLLRGSHHMPLGICSDGKSKSEYAFGTCHLQRFLSQSQSLLLTADAAFSPLPHALREPLVLL